MVYAVDDVASRIVRNLGTVETMALQKLLFYSQAWYLAVSGDRLFPNTIEAWKQGPVVRSVWKQHAHEVALTSWPSGRADRITGLAADLVDLVCEEYGGLSGWELSERTHAEESWIEARIGLGPGEAGRRPILQETVEWCFRDRTLAGYRPADLAVGGVPRPCRVSVVSPDWQIAPVRSDQHDSDARDFSNVIGFGQREIPAVDALDHLDYPTSPTRVRPVRVR